MIILDGLVHVKHINRIPTGKFRHNFLNTLTFEPEILVHPSRIYEYSGRVVEDGSYLRLKNITLGYTLPKKVLRKMHFDTMRIYLSLDNVCTWTNYSGVDPEVSTRNSVLTPGFDWSAYPRAFSVTGGISFTF